MGEIAGGGPSQVITRFALLRSPAPASRLPSAPRNDISHDAVSFPVSGGDPPTAQARNNRVPASRTDGSRRDPGAPGPDRITLRPYQIEVGRAVMRSVKQRLGLRFTVMIARQGGKNELSAQLEMLLLIIYANQGGSGIKAAPTFKPQVINSVQRLKDRLEEAGHPGEGEYGYQVRLDRARWLFFSGAEEAKVVGATATILLEGDEAQDISLEKWNRDFRPMGAVANTTTVLYGTAWDSDDLLQQAKQENLELERKDGIRRHFEYDWVEVGAYNAAYQAYVESERERLGATHPLFTTQYELKPLANRARMFSAAQLTLMHGGFPAEETPGAWTYVGGLDVAGGAEEETHDGLRQAQATPRAMGRDAMVLTVCALRDGHADVVKTYQWTGVPHHTTIPLIEQLARHWRLRQLVVDATGQGEAVASVLGKALGRTVTPFVFTSSSKSELAYELLAAVHRGELRIHALAPERLWRELEAARTQVRPSRLMNFYVDPGDGHDDYLMSLALTAHAAATVRPERTARGRTGG